MTHSADSDGVAPELLRPLFVIGRQHSGNTLLATVLGRLPETIAFVSEGQFFERRADLDRLPPEERAKRTARSVRDGGARSLIQKGASANRESVFWQEVTLEMEKAAHAGADALALYAIAITRILALFSARRWVQKATSYVFLAEEVMEAFPQAKCIFLVRNPFDIAASTKRRNGTAKHTVRVSVAWNRGVSRALHLQNTYPDHFRIVRYEDLVRTPDEVVRMLCAFGDLTYDSACTQVSHVNKSESKHNMKSKEKGINKSRVGYFVDILKKSEQQVVGYFCGKGNLSVFYPEMTYEGGTSLQAVGVTAYGVCSILIEEAARLKKKPSATTLKRIARRLC